MIIVAGSDFEGTSPNLFWPETLVYLLPGAELNQMLTLVSGYGFLVCRNERPPVCGRASGAPEKRGTNAQENL